MSPTVRVFLYETIVLCGGIAPFNHQIMAIYSSFDSSSVFCPN